ncbi:MAG TPA: hypothetical protein VFZ71_03845, partial [Pyrinomonadaceae bacterium]
MSDSNERESLERQSFLELTRSIAGLPLDQAAAILETSASISAISLRAGIEFLRAAPSAAQVLQPAELRAWGEMGRRLAMSDYETAVSFYVAGVEELQNVPQELLPAIFGLCTRQMTLSTTIGRETLNFLPRLVAEIGDTALAVAVIEVATEIARRSAKHSAEFLNASPSVTEHLRSFGDPEVTGTALSLASSFATRAGGIAADAWSAIPEALAELSPADAKRLLASANDFLERGGGAALHILLSGGEILRRAPEIFDEWITLLWIVAAHGNAGLVAFVRSSPGFLRLLGADMNRNEAVELTRRVLTLTK